MSPPLNNTALTICNSPRSVLNQLPRSLRGLTDQLKPGEIAIEAAIVINEITGPMNPIRFPFGIFLRFST
jgi:hypothetical protein